MNQIIQSATKENNVKNLLLIDGNNLAISCAFVHNLSVQIDGQPETSSDIAADLGTVKPEVELVNTLQESADGGPIMNTFPTGVLHGFFSSLASIRKTYSDHYCVVVWDGGNQRRVAATRLAVDNNIVPELYKENRHKKDAPQEILDFMKQKPELRNAISLTDIPQILIANEEADDVIASYVTQYAEHCDSIIICTSDKDYYQLLSDKVRLLRNGNLFGVHWFRKEFGINPLQWVDVGALCGDSGDNIFGIPSWGDRTAINAVIQHGSCERVMEALHREMDELRETYPDLDADGLSELQKIKLPSGKQKYPQIYNHTPFTGVAMAIEKKLLKKPKTTLLALMFEQRVHLAKQLKAMKLDLKVPTLPGWKNAAPWKRADQTKFQEFCDKYKLIEIGKDVDIICSPQPD